jgi:hypothetical protein
VGQNPVKTLRVSGYNLVLILVAALSLFVYLLMVRRLYLPEDYTLGRIDGVYIYRDKPFNQARLLVSFLVVGVLYLWGWWAVRKASRVGSTRIAWSLVIGGALACAGVLLFLYPFDAADIYDNIVHGRILGVYGSNPFLQAGRDYPDDPFYTYMAWKKNPSAYGPLWELMAGPTARLAGDQFVTNVLAFKLLPGAFWLASLAVVALFLHRIAPQEALPGVYLLAWNPIVLFSTWGNGHNDIVMVFWILLGAWALLSRHYTTAILALIAGALIKYIPVLLLPAALFITLSAIQAGWRSRLRFLALTAIFGFGLVWLAYRPFWIGPETLTIQRRAMLFTSSLPAVVYHNLLPDLGKEDAAWIVSRSAATLTLLFALWRGWRARKGDSWEDFLGASFDILVFYLLVTCLWFQQWYTVWLVGVAAMLPYAARQRLGIFISLAVLSKQLVMGPALFKPKPIYTQPELEARFTLGVLGLPWLYALWVYLEPWIPKPGRLSINTDR